MNNHFTCIGRTHGAPAVPVTREEWERLRNEPWLADMCRRIEAGDEKLKHRLPIWTPHCAEFDNNHRSIQDALKLTNQAVCEALDGLPAAKVHCSVLAEEAIKSALKDYYTRNGIEYDKSQFPDCENCAHCHE